MKFQVYIASMSLCLWGIANAASNQQLCTKTSFEAFGEPKHTVRDCADPDEMFWVIVSVDDLRYPPQGIGLVVPLTSSDNSGNISASLTTQVLKDVGKYTIRIQAVKNGEVINWMGIMRPDSEQILSINGKRVIVKFARQQS
jgi:hypothetical protein